MRRWRDSDHKTRVGEEPVIGLGLGAASQGHEPVAFRCADRHWATLVEPYEKHSQRRKPQIPQFRAKSLYLQQRVFPRV